MKFNQTNNSQTHQALDGKRELLGKVILLIGCDPSSLSNLVRQLVLKGADIALLCQKLPTETIKEIKEIVNFSGQKVLIINRSGSKPEENNELIDDITSQLGSPDAFIDLSKNESDDKKVSAGDIHLFNQQQWPLTKVVLEKMVTA